MPKVSIENHIEQVRDGESYKGYVVIGGVKFDYTLDLDVPMHLLESIEPPKTEEVLRQLFRITLKKEDVAVVLDEMEYVLFVQIIWGLVVVFYELPQTRDSNKGLLGQMARGELDHEGAAPGMEVTFALIRTFSVDLSPENCRIFTAPKFGCTFDA